ncbi:MAG: histidine kinase dimerization/phospho-acceptor domain-containing protein [Myxococcota bacterium]
MSLRSRRSLRADRDSLSAERRGGVLVVGDDADERARILDVLGPLQTETLEVSGSAAALELLGNEPTVDVMIAIHEQEGMSGGALCQYARGHARLANISTVLIAEADAIASLRLTARAADDFLPRPVDADALRQVVRNALRAQARRRLIARQERRRAIDWLAMVLSHEINNPLAAAMANLSLVRERADDEELSQLVEESHAMLERIRERTHAIRLQTKALHHQPSVVTGPELLESLRQRLTRHGRPVTVDSELAGNIGGEARWRLLVDAADAVVENSLAYCTGQVFARVHLEESRLAVVVRIEGAAEDDPEIILEPRLLSRDGESPRFYAGLSMLEQAFAEAGGQLFARPVADAWRFGLTIPVDPAGGSTHEEP